MDRYKLMLLGLTAAVFGVVLVLCGLAYVLIAALHPNDNGGLTMVEIIVLLGPIAACAGLATAYVAAMYPEKMYPENLHAAREKV